MKKIIGLLISWYVVTYGGQTVAGPFALLDDCQKIAMVMNTQNPQVSTVCQSK